MGSRPRKASFNLSHSLQRPIHAVTQCESLPTQFLQCTRPQCQRMLSLGLMTPCFHVYRSQKRSSTVVSSSRSDVPLSSANTLHHSCCASKATDRCVACCRGSANIMHEDLTRMALPQRRRRRLVDSRLPSFVPDIIFSRQHNMLRQSKCGEITTAVQESDLKYIKIQRAGVSVFTSLRQTRGQTSPADGDIR